MRITLVFPGCHHRGGVERIAWEAALYLRDHHDVTVVCRTADDLPEGVRLVEVPDSRLRGPLAGLGFRRMASPLVASTKADVVVSYGSQCPPADAYVVNSVHRAWLRTAGPVQISGRVLPGWIRYAMPRNVVGLHIERTYYRKARGRLLVPCAAQVTEDLADLYHLRDTPTVVVHNGFSANELSQEIRRELRAASRADLGYGDDDVVLVMVANEWQRKGLAVVLQAMDILSDRAELRLLLVGRSSPAPFLDRLRPGLRGRVQYVGATDRVAVQHAAADLFVLPTQYEAFCLAIIEALASGLPVITSGVPGAADAIRPGVNGEILEDPLDARGLAELLRRALDPARRQAWSEAAADSVAPYEWSTLMAQFEQALEDLVRRKPLISPAPAASRLR